MIMCVVVPPISSEGSLLDAILAIRGHQATYHTALVLAGLFLSFFGQTLAAVTLFFSTSYVTLLVLSSLDVPPFSAITQTLFLSVMTVRYASPDLLSTVSGALYIEVLYGYKMTVLLMLPFIMIKCSAIKWLAAMGVCAGAVLCADGVSFFASQVYGAESQTIVRIAVIFVLVAVAWRFQLAYAVNSEYDQIPQNVQ